MYAPHKLKKGANTMSIDLVPTSTSCASLRDDDVASGVYMVGFAAETEHVIDNARAKLEAKHLDLVVVNDVSREDIGMGADDNEVTVIGRDGTIGLLACRSRCGRGDRADHREQDAMTLGFAVGANRARDSLKAWSSR